MKNDSLFIHLDEMNTDPVFEVVEYQIDTHYMIPDCDDQSGFRYIKDVQTFSKSPVSSIRGHPRRLPYIVSEIERTYMIAERKNEGPKKVYFVKRVQEFIPDDRKYTLCSCDKYKSISNLECEHTQAISKIEWD